MEREEPRIGSLKLPFDFIPERLKHDLDLIRADEWAGHYNDADFEGDWSGAALRSSDGSIARIHAGSGESDFRNTPLIDRCPYFRQVLETFRFPLRAARLLQLRAGSVIREHSDPALSYEDGEIRVHIPVRTNPDVRFYLDGRRIALNEGETWYLNLSRPHRVQNLGATDRVHLVIDGVVNDWARSVFAAAREAAPQNESAPEEPSEFDRFRELVFEDARLQRLLMDTRDRAALIALALELGRERGILFHEDEVDAALKSGRRAWIERAVDA